MIMQEKIKVMKKKTNSEFVEFVSIPQKLHPFKNPDRLPTEPMGIHHSPHTHTIPIPMGIPMGIPIPTVALNILPPNVELKRSRHMFIACVYRFWGTHLVMFSYKRQRQVTAGQLWWLGTLQTLSPHNKNGRYFDFVRSRTTFSDTALANLRII